MRSDISLNEVDKRKRKSYLGYFPRARISLSDDKLVSLYAMPSLMITFAIV